MKLSRQEWQDFKMKNKEAGYDGKMQLRGWRTGTERNRNYPPNKGHTRHSRGLCAVALAKQQSGNPGISK
jgi:hypothetical protein